LIIISSIKSIKEKCIQNFELDINGIHGIGHWENVATNAIAIAQSNGADPVVVQLFAFIHDSCRISDDYDHDHGLRAAEWMSEWLQDYISLNKTQFNLLYEAIKNHNKGETTLDPAIGSCWDADRLELGRLDIYPDINKMSTKLCKDEVFIEWKMKELGYFF